LDYSPINHHQIANFFKYWNFCPNLAIVGIKDPPLIKIISLIIVFINEVSIKNQKINTKVGAFGLHLLQEEEENIILDI